MARDTMRLQSGMPVWGLAPQTNNSTRYFVKGNVAVLVRAPMTETVQDARTKAFAELVMRSTVLGKDSIPDFVNTQMITDALAFVAYVVKHGYDADTDWHKTVTCPQPRKVKRGLRLFPAQKPTVHVSGKYAEAE